MHRSQHSRVGGATITDSCKPHTIVSAQATSRHVAATDRDVRTSRSREHFATCDALYGGSVTYNQRQVSVR